MTLFARRKKLVTFRLTVEEYEALKSLCISNGVRSISELTREAVLQQLSADRQSRTAVSGDLVTLLPALEYLDNALRNLSGRISNVLGPPCKRSPSSSAS
jgi:hypothetical protein